MTRDKIAGPAGSRGRAAALAALRPVAPEDFAPLPPRLTFTVDVEDHPSSDGAGAPRFPAMTRRLLDLLDEHAGRGTFFVVGTAAEAAPDLVREIAARGHEVASHGHRHVPLTREDDHTGFAAALRASRERLEDIAGAPVAGFRAPLFSLTRASLWAVDAIGAAGFAYSSSALPARAIPFGLPDAPRRPFLWPNSLLEIPCPVARLGPFALPFLGGMYLRYLPPWRLRQLARRLPEGCAVWTYCHPYDADTEEPFALARGRGIAASLFLWGNRGNLEGRLRAIMAGRTSVPFAEILGEIKARTGPPPARRSAAAPSGR